MAGRRSILIFWALLMVPALILAGVAFRLLSHEKARIRQTRVTTLLDQARAVAGSIDLAIVTVQNNLTGALLELAVPKTAIGNRASDDRILENQTLEDQLLEWERQNPLVRNVFIFDPEKGLKYPQRSMAATREERQFINRFSPIFSGEISFEFNRVAHEDTPALSLESNRSDLYALSREPAHSPYASGWIPWFSDNRLYMLGWVKKNKGTYGIELEMMTLLSRLADSFSRTTGQGDSTLVLTNGSGSILLQSGDQSLTGKPAGRISVSPHLPHWTLAVYTDTTAGGTRGFMALALLLLGVLLTAIITGGIMITRLTLAKIKDARRKTSFVASVSHELKTPLTSIRMYAELLQSGRINEPSKQARYLDVIVGESGRLTRLINNVLDFGRLEQGRKKYNMAPFDVGEFLEALIGVHSIRLRKAGFDIIKTFASGPFPVVTDRDALEQAVLNLMDNALKYAENGKVIEFTLTREGEMILIQVRDNGPGIPANSAELIFEKFYRLDTSLTAAKPGSGLGLSIARQMLRDLGGDLHLDTHSVPADQLAVKTDSNQNQTMAHKTLPATFTIRIPSNENN